MGERRGVEMRWTEKKDSVLGLSKVVCGFVELLYVLAHISTCTYIQSLSFISAPTLSAA